MTTGIDPNNHAVTSYSDALGRSLYIQQESGGGASGGSFTPNEQRTIQYNVLDEPTQIQVTDLAPQSNQTVTSVTTTAHYDSLGRLTQVVDPDRGTHTYTYDGDGQVLTDVSGSRTLGYNDDFLGRVGCVQDAAPTVNPSGSCSAGNPLLQNTYDTTVLGTQGSTDFPVGHLTKSVATTYYPDSGNPSATTIQKMQYDLRGRLITQQVKFTLPSSWNVTNALPTYQAALSYNDANQLTTTITSMLNPNTSGYTTTQVYDATGNLHGLSNTGNATANLATLHYNVNALVDTVNFQTSTNTALANEQFTYDGDLRPATATSTWLSGSGTSGTIFQQSRSYDAASNVISLTTTQATVSGQSLSGGSETQNFCYDEQNRLVWAGNSGSEPGAGHGTCGSGPLGNSLNGASYQNSFVYTHLGQLWQGPLNGSSTAYQYFYCGSAPHQLSGLYSSGTTCANKSGALYKSSTDAWGNVTSRTYQGTSATLAYDSLDQQIKWSTDSSNTEYDVYDAAGTRVLRRTTTSGTTTITVYAFGLEEHSYDGSGTPQSDTYYYSLGGQLLGELNGSTARTTFFLTDGLGSVMSTFTNTAGNASVQGNQVYGPYGSQRYAKGSLGTAKGFIGQYADGGSGLDYFNARYYDPVVGLFLSADSVQGNPQGMNPYAYGGGNPETWSDPTGHYIPCPNCDSGGDGSGGTGGGSGGGGMSGGGGGIGGSGGSSNSGSGSSWSWITGDIGTIEQTAESVYQQLSDPETDPLLPAIPPIVIATAPVWLPPVLVVAIMAATAIGLGLTLGAIATVATTITLDPGTIPLGASGSFSQAFQVTAHSGGGSPQPQSGGAGGRPPGGGSPATAPSDPCSFTPETQVATDHGEQAIGTLHVGDKVWAYNPKTHRMERQPILHVWTHSDSDLVDLTLTTTTTVHGHTTHKSEVMHTTSEHPFLTTEHGFTPVGNVKVGMHVRRADGTVGVVTGWKIVHSTKLMYNLEVAHDHTFTVGVGQWVVHNKCGSKDYRDLRKNLAAAGRPVQEGQQGHHILPCALRDDPLIQRAGFDINSAANGFGLPTSEEMSLQQELPQHLGSHGDYTGEVSNRLTDARNTLGETYGDINNVPVNVAMQSLTNVIDGIRNAILGAGGGCSINDIFLD